MFKLKEKQYVGEESSNILVQQREQSISPFKFSSPTGGHSPYNALMVEERKESGESPVLLNGGIEKEYDEEMKRRAIKRKNDNKMVWFLIIKQSWKIKFEQVE